jgi:short-subunit dehydrogenase
MKKQYALITGATSGFGYEFAKLFAADKYNLILVARNSESLQQVASELNSTFNIEVKTIAEDLFSVHGAAEVYRTVSSWDIEVDVLVNDAGQGEYGKFLEYDLDRDIDLVQLNVTSLVALTKYFGKEMVARNRGKILQVASLLSKYPTPMMAVYAGTKAFVLSFAEGLMNELSDTNVTVTVLMPGAADTDFFHKAGAEGTVTYRETELSDPKDVAKDGYEALMSGESKIVSGAKNKLQSAMSNVMPGSALASTMRKQMAPSEKEEGREEITHPASRLERERIQNSIGQKDGDLQEHDDHVHEK